jgi:SAM-dependent methyltransferase
LYVGSIDVTDPADLYSEALSGGVDLVARLDDGTAWPVDVAPWLGCASASDERLLARAYGPVLDVGCGPGRHVHALARRGILAVGVDVTPAAVALARRGGADVVHGSIFDHLPGAGTWSTALLLDGNIGIGGCPIALLGRLATMLRSGGRVLAELEAPGSGLRSGRVRLDGGARTSAPFAWARVAVDAIDEPAAVAGFGVTERWSDDGRWFAALEAGAG